MRGTPTRSIIQFALERVILRDLRRTFRRVVWAGPGTVELPPGPVVLYANHHYVHDSYVLWLVASRTLGRPARVWMEEWNRVPVFAPIGAMPFPADDAAARSRTIRSTVRWLEAGRDPVLLLYPEGRLSPPDAGLLPFKADLQRLASVFPERTTWVPAAIHVTWWGEARPTAVVALGTPHAAPDGVEAERLETLLASLKFIGPSDLHSGSSRVLLEGKRGMDERARLGFSAPFFRRAVRGRERDG
jgi:1-acyl-sn-glycerol-3-phosphate acyltransferase